jgi:hypothetical protein
MSCGMAAFFNNLGTKLISRASTLALRLVLSPASKVKLLLALQRNPLWPAAVSQINKS